MDDDERTGTCAKCGQEVTQFDTEGGHWVGDLESGGKYECPKGSLHRPSLRTLGEIVLREAGEAACQSGYLTTDPEWVGRYALQYGDIDDNGTLS